MPRLVKLHFNKQLLNAFVEKFENLQLIEIKSMDWVSVEFIELIFRFAVCFPPHSTISRRRETLSGLAPLDPTFSSKVVMDLNNSPQ